MKYQGVMVSNDGGMEKAESRRCFGSGEKEQESWKGRLEEMSFEKTTKKVFVGEMERKRPKGRPHLRWIDNFK